VGNRITPRLIFAVVTTVLEEVALAAIVLWGLPQLDIYVPLGVLIAIMAAWAVNAVIFYLIGSRALRRKPVSGLGTMVGGKGRVVNALAPDGVVKISDELWEARAASGRIDAGEEVTVVEQDGLKLVVVKTAASKESFT
jgi:membrane-bound ClpP family serine protease